MKIERLEAARRSTVLAHRKPRLRPLESQALGMAQEQPTAAKKPARRCADTDAAALTADLAGVQCSDAYCGDHPIASLSGIVRGTAEGYHSSARRSGQRERLQEGSFASQEG